MSKIKDNMITTGLSGKLGKQIVFRQWSGDTFLAKAPVISKSFDESKLRKMQKYLISRTLTVERK